MSVEARDPARGAVGIGTRTGAWVAVLFCSLDLPISARLREETDLDNLSYELVGVAHDTMQPVQVALWLQDEAGIG